MNKIKNIVATLMMVTMLSVSTTFADGILVAGRAEKTRKTGAVCTQKVGKANSGILVAERLQLQRVVLVAQVKPGVGQRLERDPAPGEPGHDSPVGGQVGSRPRLQRRDAAGGVRDHPVGVVARD